MSTRNKKRKKEKMKSVVWAVAATVALVSYSVGGYPYTGIRNHVCNGATTDDIEYRHCVQDTLQEVVSKTSGHGYNYLPPGNSKDNQPGECYVHGACDGGLSPYECLECLWIARDYMNNICGFRIGAQMTLDDCRIRYENYNFNTVY